MIRTPPTQHPRFIAPPGIASNASYQSWRKEVGRRKTSRTSKPRERTPLHTGPAPSVRPVSSGAVPAGPVPSVRPAPSGPVRVTNRLDPLFGSDRRGES